MSQDIGDSSLPRGRRHAGAKDGPFGVNTGSNIRKTDVQQPLRKRIHWCYVRHIEPSEDRRTSNAATRRRQREREIIDATRHLFDDRGVRDAQIEDIAKAVGINRAIVYRHFTGKEELFALTLVQYLDELRVTLYEVTADTASATPRDQLIALVSAFADYGIEHPAFVDCALALMRRSGDDLFAEVSECNVSTR